MVTTIAAGAAAEHDVQVLQQAATQLPADSPARALLRQLTEALARGAGVALLEQDTDLTPNQAAAMLQMSRTHLLTFMDLGDLPFHRVGAHRRIRTSDLLEFADRRERAAQTVAQALGSARAARAEAIDRLAPLDDDVLAQLDEP